VPEGSARLRISVTLNASQDEIDAMVATLARKLEELPA